MHTSKQGDSIVLPGGHKALTPLLQWPAEWQHPAKLQVEADRLFPDRPAAATGAIAAGDLSHPDIGTVLDGPGDHVLRPGGEMTIFPADRMHRQTGAAATYRF